MMLPNPHAVAQAGTNQYQYDANGNMITRSVSDGRWNDKLQLYLQRGQQDCRNQKERCHRAPDEL